MARLEYRRLDEANDFPVLYVYENIDLSEIAARFACDRFIKDGTVYERTSCAIETMAHVVYLEEIEREMPDKTSGETEKTSDGVRIELRQDGESETPGLLIQAFTFSDGLEVVNHLLCDYWLWMGEEWLKTQSVLDEDHRVYRCYAKRTD